MRYNNSIGWIAADGPGSGVLEVRIDWQDAEATVEDPGGLLPSFLGSLAT
jgi:hypothetical protein